jgi:hypothetical protein
MRRARDWFRRRIGMSRRTGTRRVAEQRRGWGTLLADWAARLVVSYPVSMKLISTLVIC